MRKYKHTKRIYEGYLPDYLENLKDYTYNQYKSLDNDIIETLIDLHPNERKTVLYRGLNFLNKEDLDSFLSNVKYSRGYGVLKINSYASFLHQKM